MQQIQSPKKVVIAISGASGSLYAHLLIRQLLTISDQWSNLAVVMSTNARQVWETELPGVPFPGSPVELYGSNDFNAAFASGSGNYDTMIIVPCSMGTLGRIAGGISNDLMTRAADVILKERRKLICVARETPYNLVHLRNMETITVAGGIICPATPSFYSLPKNIEELAMTVVSRVVDLAGFRVDSYRWGQES